MKLKTIYWSGHATLLVSYDDETFLDKKYCGDSWCTGACGLSALVLMRNDEEFKAHGTMVAHGPVFQKFRVRWTGAKEAVDHSANDVSQLLTMMWL